MTDDELLYEAQKLVKRFEQMRIIGEGWSGNVREGWKFNRGGAIGGGLTPIGANVVPTPPPTGACCLGTDCSIHTHADCTALGGTYQGDGTLCTPNPCAAPPCVNCGFGGFGGTPVPCEPYGCQTINCDGTYSNPAPAPYWYLTAICTECATGVQHIVTVDPTTCIASNGCGCGPGCNSCICPECYNPPYCGAFSVQLSDPFPQCP